MLLALQSITPHISRPYFRLIVELIDLALGASFVPTFHPEVIIRIVPSSAHLWEATAVVVPKMTAPTPPHVAQTFVRVMTAFGDDWLALRKAAAAMVVSLRW